MPPERIADTLALETARLREAGLLPDTHRNTSGGAGQSAQAAASPLLSPGDLGDPDCPHCRGLGYTRADRPLATRDQGTRAPEEFGKLEMCACARERTARAQTAQLQRATGLDDVDLALSWGVLYQTAGIEAGRRALRETLLRGWGWVYLHGAPGPGKTVLLKTAVAESVRAGRGAVFVTWPDLLAHLRAGFDAGDYDERVSAWRAVRSLAVDEFGRAKDTEWVREAQVRVFNHRYESALRRETVTLFASNFAPDSERVDDWFYDRLRDGRFQICEVAGPSLRPAMKD